MKTKILILIFFIIASIGYGQNFTSFTVFQNKTDGIQKTLQSVNNNGYINIDTIEHVITIVTTDDCSIIQGHSMKKLSDNRYRFHKYNKENSDFEVEICNNKIILYTHLAFWNTNYKYKTIFQIDNSLLSVK